MINEDQTRFCGECGARLNPPPTPAAAQTQAPPPQAQAPRLHSPILGGGETPEAAQYSGNANQDPGGEMDRLRKMQGRPEVQQTDGVPRNPYDPRTQQQGQQPQGQEKPVKKLRSPLLAGDDEYDDEQAPQAPRARSNEASSASGRQHLHSPLLGDAVHDPASGPITPASTSGRHLHSPLLGDAGSHGEDPRAHQGQGQANTGSRPHLHSPLLGGGDDDDEYYEDPAPHRGGLHSPILGGGGGGGGGGRGGLRSPILGGAASGGGNFEEYYDEDDDPYADEGNPNILRSPLLSSKLDYEHPPEPKQPKQQQQQRPMQQKPAPQQQYQQPAPQQQYQQQPAPQQQYQQPAPQQQYQQPAPQQQYQQPAPQQQYQQPAPQQQYQQPAPQQQFQQAVPQEAQYQQPVFQPSAPHEPPSQFSAPAPVFSAPAAAPAPTPGPSATTAAAPAPGGPVFSTPQQLRQAQNASTATPAPTPGTNEEEFPDMSQFRRDAERAAASGSNPPVSPTVVPVSIAAIPEPFNYVPPELAPGDMQSMAAQPAPAPAAAPPSPQPAPVSLPPSPAAAPASRLNEPPAEKPQQKPLKRSSSKLLGDADDDEMDSAYHSGPAYGAPKGQAPFPAATQASSPLPKILGVAAIVFALFKMPLLLNSLAVIGNPTYTMTVVDMIGTTLALLALGLAVLMSKN